MSSEIEAEPDLAPAPYHDQPPAHASMPLGFRVQPHNIDAEQAFLGAALINNRTIIEAGQISADMFYEPVHRRIFAAMRELIDAERLADHVTLLARFRDDDALAELDGPKYLAGLARAAVSVGTAKHYARAIEDCYFRRMIIEVAEQATVDAYDTSTGTDWKAICARLSEGIGDLTKQTGDDQIVRADQVLEVDLLKHIETPPVKIQTGLKPLDRSLGGGMRPGVTLLEGEAKKFKSGVAGSILWEAMRNPEGGCAPVSLEMASRQQMQRLVGGHSDLDYQEFERAERLADAVEAIYRFKANHAGLTKCYMAHVPGITIDALVAMLDRLRYFYGCKSVIIDYWQRIGGQPRNMGRAEFLEYTSNRLADYGEANELAILLISQLNRQGQSFGSGGATRACNWAATIHTVDAIGARGMPVTGIWLEVTQARFGRGNNIGSGEDPAFKIDTGPVLREWL